jgi:hypothetical protein
MLKIVRSHVLACALVGVLGGPVAAVGQWINYPTPDLPRKADGKPDLTRPTPRMSDGKPNLSGLWHADTAARVPECGGRPDPVRQRDRRITTRRQSRP